MGHKVADILSAQKLSKIVFVVSNATAETVDSHSGLSVISPELFLSKGGGLIVVSSFRFFVEISTTLSALGIRESNIVSPYGFFNAFYLPEFRRAFERFDDEISWQTVLDKLSYLIRGFGMKPFNADSIYFNREFLDLTDDEIFVDGGAFDGGTVLEFIESVGGKYRRVYSFEPRTESFENTAVTLKGLHNVEVVHKGIYSHSGVLEFTDFEPLPGQGAGVALSEYTQAYSVKNFYTNPSHNYQRYGDTKAMVTKVEVCSLDDFFRGKPVSEYPTLIKLDIEGSEMEALKGMANILIERRPKLVVCAYHKIEDYFQLSETILEINPTYKLTLRHYSDNILDSVIYAT
jgi:FkbM family methyltransferase